ncbi:hypothetical protein TRSC58_04259 [Trypanosoma rangeli SC58]|uniref:Uncharacterized protein n=1 Tax=Trypanosoma rangeli SC58 TaxID=429131 RepID=A0A061J1R7_TRYRA|nr:hypothetical protein TRSC58_04259 [Trypanosoma rangeli SC58]
MKYLCGHSFLHASQDNVAASTRAKAPSCSATIVTLQSANAALTRDLEQCLDILRGARAFTDEVEKVVTAVPAFVASMQRHMQALMLLQHGVFLENATVLFRLWHRDRDALLEAFERGAHDAHESYRCEVESIVEQHEAELKEVHGEWRGMLEATRAELVELTRRLQSAEEYEQKEARHTLLKKAAAVIERNQRGGCNSSTQTSQDTSAVACQTADVYRRSVAVQTTEEEHQWRVESKRSEKDEEERGPEPHVSVPVAFLAEAPSMNTPREERGQQGEHNALELDVLRLELQQLCRDYAHEREATVTARANCAVLEDTLRAQFQEVTFLRDALDRIESGVFSSPVPLASFDSNTLLERLALVGEAGLNPSPRVCGAVGDTRLREGSLVSFKWTV